MKTDHEIDRKIDEFSDEDWREPSIKDNTIVDLYVIYYIVNQ